MKMSSLSSYGWQTVHIIKNKEIEIKSVDLLRSGKFMVSFGNGIDVEYKYVVTYRIIHWSISDIIPLNHFDSSNSLIKTSSNRHILRAFIVG